MKCLKCQSENLEIVEAGPHKKLVCKECLCFVKFLKKAEAKNFQQLQGGVTCEPKKKDTSQRLR